MALPTITLPNVSTPQIVPGGQFADPVLQDAFDRLQDIINEIVETINNLTVEINNNSLTIGLGQAQMWHVLTQSDYGSGGAGDTPTTSSQLVGGAVCMALTQDKQLVVGTWHNAGFGVNTFVIQLLKAAYPYNRWTNLAGDSKAPTTVSYTGTNHNNGNPCIVQSADGDLHVGFFNSTVGVASPQHARFTRDGDGWVLAATQTLLTTHIFRALSEGEIIQTADGNYLWARSDTRTGPVHSVHIYRRLNGSWGTGPVATYTSYYDPTVPSCISLGTEQGEDSRIVEIDAERVVAFWMWRGNSTDLRYTLLYTMSRDGGATWPQSACSGTNYAIGYPATATGSIFPLDGGTPPVPEANLRISGGGGIVYGRLWDVAHIPGTSRVAIVVWGDDAAAVGHSQLPGIRYLEFDADGNGGLGSVTEVADWITVNVQVPLVSLMLSVSDGIVRVLWAQGMETTLNEGAVSLCYSRVVDDGDPLEPADWTTPREVLRFANQDGSPNLQYRQFTTPVSGVFTMENEEKVWPLLFARSNMGAVTIGNATEQALFALLRVAGLDRV